jgi:hypothetical protein
MLNFINTANALSFDKKTYDTSEFRVAFDGGVYITFRNGYVIAKEYPASWSNVHFDSWKRANMEDLIRLAKLSNPQLALQID